MAAAASEQAAQPQQGSDRRAEAPPDEWRNRLADLPEDERSALEGKWGFSRGELADCLKVVNALRADPEVFLNDPVLKSTNLWRWVNRAPQLRKDAKRVHQQLTKEAEKQKRKHDKAEDRRKLARTEMRVARNEALTRLLTIDPSQQRALLVEEEGGPTLMITGSEGDAAAAAGADGDATMVPAGGGEKTVEELAFARKCHICKDAFTQLHQFYYSLCRPCGEFNFGKRNQTRNLTGKHVLLTGARIKIGFQIALRLLRDGAELWATTRFPRDAVKRFEHEPDFAEWSHRLHMHQVDLRDLWSVKQFCRYLEATIPCLFGIVHNAAQTIARPPEYYQALIEGEMAGGERPKLMNTQWQDFVDRGGSSYVLGHQQKLEHPAGAAPLITGSAAEAVTSSSAAEGETTTMATVITDEGSRQVVLPVGRSEWYDMYDTLQEGTDRRSQNSWTSNMADVSCEEAAEVHAINALAPFIINARLKNLLTRRPPESPKERHFIINVSAMEGQFYRYKSTCHPHTNMAKASMNMMTRTSGADYAKDNIMMNSVDTGWITDEAPHEIQARRTASGNLCPLDEVDAAARVLDLMYTDSPEHSKFWKDYQVIPW